MSDRAVEILGVRLGVWPTVAGLIALQACVLGWMVWGNEALLRSGQEVVLDVQPVDPRSLFRGDYVILDYTDLSRLKGPVLDGLDRESAGESAPLRRGGSLAVLLAPGEAGNAWRPVAVRRSCAQGGDTQHACLMGTIEQVIGQGAERSIHLRYGLENYFVPEGEGRVLEDAIEIKKLQVIVAVGGPGNALIKGLVIDGTRMVDEGLF